VIVDEVQEDRLNWIKYNVFRFEDLLDQPHVILCDFFFFIRHVRIYFTYMSVVLGQLNLTRYSINPLVQIILRLCA